ncbi:hypothetical protein BVI2075_140020 [Burkholderia vietnamiensis]|nr:hypothetical protein BVI2075_140020 [Burkholderia vietnamiensis]
MRADERTNLVEKRRRRCQNDAPVANGRAGPPRVPSARRPAGAGPASGSPRAYLKGDRCEVVV